MCGISVTSGDESSDKLDTSYGNHDNDGITIGHDTNGENSHNIATDIDRTKDHNINHNGIDTVAADFGLSGDNDDQYDDHRLNILSGHVLSRPVASCDGRAAVGTASSVNATDSLDVGIRPTRVDPEGYVRNTMYVAHFIWVDGENSSNEEDDDDGPGNKKGNDGNNGHGGTDGNDGNDGNDGHGNNKDDDDTFEFIDSGLTDFH